MLNANALRVPIVARVATTVTTVDPAATIVIADPAPLATTTKTN